MVEYFLQAWHRTQKKIKHERGWVSRGWLYAEKKQHGQGNELKGTEIWFLKSKIMKRVGEKSYFSPFSNKCHEQTANQPLQSSVHMHINDDWGCLCSIHSLSLL